MKSSPSRSTLVWVLSGRPANFYDSLVTDCSLFGAAYWLVHSAGLIEDVSIVNLSKVFLRIILILASAGIAIH
jgi:hypothetical protein